MFRGLKPHKFIILYLWLEVQERSHWAKIKVWQMGLPSILEALEENLIPCHVQLLEAACIPWLVLLFPILKVRNGRMSPFHMASL